MPKNKLWSEPCAKEFYIALCPQETQILLRTVSNISKHEPPEERRALIAGRAFIHNVKQLGLLKTGRRLPRPARGLPSSPSAPFHDNGHLANKAIGI